MFTSDAFGVRQRREIGVERLLWSSDTGHIGAGWLHSWKTIEATVAGVPEAERRAILAGNARRPYGS